MEDNQDHQNAAAEDHEAKKAELPPAAQRALAEAKQRRASIDAKAQLPKELNGRKGPEPVRYGDWENKGIAVDF